MLFKIELSNKQLRAVYLSGVLPSWDAVTSRGHKSSLRRPQFVFERHFPFLSLSKTRLWQKKKKKEVKGVLNSG